MDALIQSQLISGHVWHHHCRYRVFGSHDLAAAAGRRLDSVVREKVPELFSAALDQLFRDDPTVYVLRHVKSYFSLDISESTSDNDIAKRWAERLAGAVVRTIADPDGNESDLICFKDQADYVAHFVTDLIAGRAWDRWYYRAFTALRSLSTPDALKAALLDNREHLPAVLGHLHALGVLEKLLREMDESTVRVLWLEGLIDQAMVDPAAINPLFNHAVQIVDRLGLWAAPGPDQTALFEAYLAAVPASPSWGDRAAMTAALIDILSFLSARRAIRSPAELDLPAFHAQLDRVLAAFDWLDTQELRSALLKLSILERPLPPTRPMRGAQAQLTPRQKQLLEDLCALIAAGDVKLESGQPNSSANALRLYAALVARSGHWQGEPMVTSLIRQLLTAWEKLARLRISGETRRLLAHGDFVAALRTMPANDQDATGSSVRFVMKLGEPGAKLFQMLLNGYSPVGELGHGTAVEQKKSPQTSPNGSRPSVGRSFETGCAGIFLLMRAVLDARLIGLSVDSGWPNREASSVTGGGGLTGQQGLLLALGLRWAGAGGLSGDEPHQVLDPGLALFAGLNFTPPLEELRLAWSATHRADHRRFQKALLKLLAMQRFLSGSALHFHAISGADGQTALVGGDERGGLWPLGQHLEKPDSMGHALHELIGCWTEVKGRPPEMIVGDAALFDDETRRVLGDVEIVALGEGQPGSEDGRLQPIAAAYEANRQSLESALTALAAGRLGLPDADLTLALTAAALLRMWTRWLRNFADSSTPYLLQNFIHRPGYVTIDDQGILVEMASRPLDIVMEMAGYTADIRAGSLA